jgi:hypothetical protein
VTEERARTIANVVLVSAGAAAAVVVLTKPPLRRLALQALRHWLGGATVPQYLLAETRRAWAASGAAAGHAS